jgi:hypothetical protein
LIHWIEKNYKSLFSIAFFLILLRTLEDELVVISLPVFSDPWPDTVLVIEMGEMQKAPPKLTIPPDTVLMTMLSLVINKISLFIHRFLLFYEQIEQLG